MKYSLRIAAAGACLSAISLSSPAVAADAASVQLYGLIDTGIEYANHGPQGGSHIDAGAGNWFGSRWGLRGAEDLGGGTKTVFALESGFNSATGTSLQGSRLFGRQAYVGLSDKTWGELTLGRHNTLMIDWMSKFNPYNNSNFGGKDVDPAFSDRMDNSAKYTKKFGAVTLGAYYSFGFNNDQDWTDKARGRMVGLGLRYSADGLTAAVLYHSKRADAPKAPATSDNREDRILAGISYKITDFTFYGGYRWLDQELTSRSYVSHLFWAGITYRPVKDTRLSAVVYHERGTACDNMNVGACPAVQQAGRDQHPSLITLGAEYDLSKRTTLYSLASYAINGNGSSVSVLGGKYGVNVEPGRNQLGGAVGIVHRF
ncbi:outer membrane porin protein [Bordetella ansorpii]|uniref:Outer membrane porin protein n=1 Tax=Bordetella ansorpii TaxID=288768 RepID=A0A157R9D8_9BORD|nr:porin [Bordetella ansorpii]SAI54568.1 outer membrane porin protein [Bordetella ansorpii]